MDEALLGLLLRCAGDASAVGPGLAIGTAPNELYWKPMISIFLMERTNGAWIVSQLGGTSTGTKDSKPLIVGRTS